MEDGHLDLLWRFWRGAMVLHMERERPVPGDSQDKFRERAEKAGLVAVVEFVTSGKLPNIGA